MSLENTVLNEIDDSKVIQLLRDLVRIPSISLQEREIGEYIVEQLRGWGFEPERQYADKNRFNVICRLIGKEKGPTILFNGHIDTQKTDGMLIDPFSGELKDGRVYGRGSADMKSGICAIMSAFEAIKKAEIDLKGEAMIVFTVGEEYDSKGIKAFAESNLRTDMGVCAEISNLRLAIGHKGILSGEITTKGKATHSSVPKKGINAISKMIKIIEGLHSLPLFEDEDPLYGRSTVNVGTIKGGRFVTWVPDYCTMGYNFRLIPKHTPQLVNDQINYMLNRLKERDQEMEVDFSERKGSSAVKISLEEPIVEISKNALNYVLNKPIDVWVAPYNTDAAVLIRECKIPTVVVGPGDIEAAHSATENVSVEETINATKAYALMVLYALT